MQKFIEFFIGRPIFAIVCSAFLILAGLVCVSILPITKYPDIAPKQINISSIYIGASAEIVESAVTIPLEQELNGLEGVRYISSRSSDTGVSDITVTLEPWRDPDLAMVDIQNKIKNVEGILPSEVIKTGIGIRKSSDSFLMVIGLYAEHGEYDEYFISNYASRYVRETLQRVPGIANISIFGERKYAMRIWLNPQKMASYSVSPQEVERALREQNIQIPVGLIGGSPISDNQKYQISIKAPDRLESAEEFEAIIIRKQKTGSLLKLKDIAEIKLGAENYNTRVHLNGYPNMVGMLVMQLPGTNAIEVDSAIKAKMKELSKDFPPGLSYAIPFNPTKDIINSINSVFWSLIMAVVLVVLVIYAFLQNWRSTLVPVITIPISLLGTFIFIKAFDFSINTLTLFGITLATGLVVDDAIVVLENITRYIFEKGHKPDEAARLSMKEITSAVIATSLVLVAVFLPVAMLPGTVGNLYREFALTIVFSIIISTLIALILSPALSAIMIKENTESTEQDKKPYIFQKFDKFLNWSKEYYLTALSWCLKRQRLVFISFGVMILLAGLLYKITPASFVPEEDQGYFVVLIQTNSGTAMAETERIMTEAEQILMDDKNIDAVVGIVGWSFAGAGPNKAILFPNLIDIRKRHGFKNSSMMVMNKLRGKLSSIKNAQIIPFSPPTVRGLGAFGGFQMELLINNDQATLIDLDQYTKELTGQANMSKKLNGVFSSYEATSPKLKLNINRDKMKALGLDLDQVLGSMQILMGSKYINDFDFMNRTYRVYLQAEEQFRNEPSDLTQIYLKNNNDAMIPLGSFVEIVEIAQPQNIGHYNLRRTAAINGSAAPGISSKEAIKTMDKLAKEILPSDFSWDWSGIAYEEIRNNGQGIIVFILGIICVFLVLAAQYNNFRDPFIILLIVPIAVFGGLAGQFLRGLSNDVFCQLGLVMLIGLSSKNSILIVEYANQLKAEGHNTLRAIIQACKIRFRPVLMTSFSFILGILPLVFASGSGAASRQSLGTTVFGGMLFATIISLVFVPVFYYVLDGLRSRIAKKPNTS